MITKNEGKTEEMEKKIDALQTDINNLNKGNELEMRQIQAGSTGNGEFKVNKTDNEKTSKDMDR